MHWSLSVAFGKTDCLFIQMFRLVCFYMGFVRNAWINYMHWLLPIMRTSRVHALCKHPIRGVFLGKYKTFSACQWIHV